MNYTDLKTNIQDICEKTFTSDQLDMFTQQAEQKIFNTVQFPDLRKVDATALTASQATYTFPTDLIWVYSFGIIDGSSDVQFLVNKDVNFIREAYPASATTGTPKHYAYYSSTQFLLGPTPDSNYTTELIYGHYPTSIVSAGNTWLGDNYDTALLNGALVEAIRFMKGEADMVALYEQHYTHSITLLQEAADGKMREDAYRSGQRRR